VYRKPHPVSCALHNQAAVALGPDWPLLELDCDFNDILVRSFVLTGAPPSTHLRTRDGAGPTGQDGAFKHVLAAFDADLGIIDLNHIDKRLQIGLPERH
jgi:hypothetical protein